MFTPHITTNKMANTCYEKQLYESFIVLYDNIEKKTPFVAFLGAFAKLRKATIRFVMSVSQSARNNLAPTERIFMKFDI